MAKNIFFSYFVCRLIFLAICSFLLNLPSPNLSNIGSSYGLLFDGFWVIAITHPFFILLAWRINSGLLIKWKILLKGKYFWLRSIGSSGIAEIIFSTVLIPEQLFYFGFKEVIHYDFWLLSFRIFFMAVFAFPSTIVVNVLKIVEHVDVYDHGIKFNPFKKEKSVET